MPRPSVPSLTLHKASGRARVRLNGVDHYCGWWGTAEAQAKYDRLIAEWLANGRSIPNPKAVLTIKSLVALFLKHAAVYYKRTSGARTSEVVNFRHAFAPLLTLYSGTPAGSFGPQQLKAVRQRMIDDGLCRNVINQRVQKIRRLFKWAAADCLLPSSVFHALTTVEGLKRGRTEANESDPVKPVPESHVATTMSAMSKEARAAVEMLLLTGARAGEICRMAPNMIDMSGPVWVYRPLHHKTLHHGKTREIYLNERAQQLIRDRLTTNPALPVFRNRCERAFTPNSLLWAAYKAATKTGTPRWSLNQLRHNVATTIRRTHGLDVAASVLGHSKPDTTLIYAEPHRQAAMQAVAMLG